VFKILKNDSAIPLYHQIREIIRTEIERGILKPNEQIPTEQELIEKYNASRITIRSAISDLVKEGLLVKKQGKGTFVSMPKIKRELISVSSFSHRMLEAGLTPGSKVLSKKLLDSTPTINKYLELNQNEQVIVIERLRLADDEPVMIEKVFIPYKDYPLVMEADIGIGSLYKFLGEKYNAIPTKSKRSLEIVLSNKYESDLLNIRVGQPLFLLSAIVKSQHSRPIEYVKTLIRGDRFKFEI
jgi:GntR family transcriptional regulator